MAQIVLVEDERELALLTERSLVDAGHRVETFGDGEGAVARLLASDQPEPDLIVLDLMLPGIDGLEVCRRVRRQRITPILMLTARSSELDKVLGLELGADDYLTKPFSPRELLARVSSILRRVEMMRDVSRTESAAPQLVVHDALRIDPSARSVTIGGHQVALTPKEFDLLHLLASNAGRVFSRDYLLDRVWGVEFEGFDRTVDTHILRLRRKLSDAPNGEEISNRIATLWGVGYKFAADSANGAG
jgi:DNA-binding response OmpR family regulator